MSQGNYCKLESDTYVPSLGVLEKIAQLYETTLHEILISEDNQVPYNQESQHSINGFMVWQDSQKIFEELIVAKDKIIELQKEQIDLLKNQLKELEDKFRKI